MKSITPEQANVYLSSIGAQIGDWNQITDAPNHYGGKSSWEKFHPPKDSLLNFSYHSAQWLPKGAWKILQIDNSTGWIDPVQASLFCGLLFGENHTHDINQIGSRTFLFEFGSNERINQSTDLLIANLIYVLLLFELHGYVVSSKSHGKILGLQDGFVYFSSRESGVSGAEILIKDFERNPTLYPRWIADIIAAGQEKMLNST
jgi:hypothetical protein